MKKNFIRRVENYAGLTLLEIVVVVAILATLAGFLVPSLAHVSAQGRTTAAKASLAQIRDAIVGSTGQPGYFHDTGTLPVTLGDLLTGTIPSGLQAFDRDANIGWRGPYLLGGVSIDGAKFAELDPTFKGSAPFDYVLDPAMFTADHAILDPWGRPILIQHAKIVDYAGTYKFDIVHRDGVTVTQIAGAYNSFALGDYSRLVSAGPDGVISTPGNALYPFPNTRGDDLILFLFRSDVAP